MEEDVKKHVIELYQSGMSVYDIAKKTLYTSYYIYNVLRLAGIYESKNPRKFITYDEFKRNMKISDEKGLNNYRKNIILDFIEQQEKLLDLYRENYGESMHTKKWRETDEKIIITEAKLNGF